MSGTITIGTIITIHQLCFRHPHAVLIIARHSVQVLAEHIQDILHVDATDA